MVYWYHAVVQILVQFTQKASSTTKTGRHVEILLKVALSIKNQIKSVRGKGRHGRGRMVVGLTTTCAISASIHSKCLVLSCLISSTNRWLGLWGLTPLSTIFQLYRQFCWWRKPWKCSTCIRKLYVLHELFPFKACLKIKPNSVRIRF
jgi:hypothetical protein